MELSPRIYRYFVRPKWYTKRYIDNTLKFLFSDFNFDKKKILDFGCGIGSNCSLFNSKDYIGIDCDSRRIQYAKRLYPKYKFQDYDGNNLNFSNNSFDYILIMAVLHHIPQDKIIMLLKQFHKILKPYGKIIVIEPCFLDNFNFNNWYMKTFDKGKFICKEKGYLKMFEENNYKTKVIKRFQKSFFYNELFFTAVPNQ